MFHCFSAHFNRLSVANCVSLFVGIPAVAVWTASAMTKSAPAVTPMLAADGKIQWKDIQIIEDLVGISGGLLNKPLSAPSILIKSGETHMRFVEVNKNDKWFL